MRSVDEGSSSEEDLSEQLIANAVSFFSGMAVLCFSESRRNVCDAHTLRGQVQFRLDCRDDVMATIEKIDIPDSDAIAAVRYFPQGRGLEVTFQSEAIYLYHGVSAKVAEGFSHADSAGRYFHEHILDRYPFTRLK
jgi:hypothetical protein